MEIMYFFTHTHVITNLHDLLQNTKENILRTIVVYAVKVNGFDKVSLYFDCPVNIC